jgi:hypothetical protein
MPSKTDLCSSALVLIGDKPIGDLYGTDRRSIVANQLYKRVKQAELAKFRWGFARKKAQLSLLAEEPIDSEWRSIYQLPTDLITLIKINPSVDYQIIGDKLYCNLSQALYAEYIYDIDETLFPPHFSRVMEYALAKDFSNAITDNNTTRQMMAEEYIIQSRMARAMDSQQHPQKSFRDQPFIKVRF